MHDDIVPPPHTVAILQPMTKLDHIQSSIEQLSPEEVARLSEWLGKFNGRQFDEAIERDAKAGKLDALADKVLAEHKLGPSRKL